MTVETKKTVTVLINNKSYEIITGITVAAALINCGIKTFHNSVSGQPRAPLCGMGICFECRVTINKEKHCLSCQTFCTEGMVVETDETN